MTDTFDPLATGGQQYGDDFGVDFNGVKDWGGDFFIFPAGSYVYTISAVEPTRSKPKADGKGNNPMIVLSCSLNADLYPDICHRAPIQEYLTLTKDALPKVKQAYGAIMRIPSEVLNTMRLQAGWWNDLLGKDVVAITTIESRQIEDTQNPGQMRTVQNMRLNGFLPFDPAKPPTRPPMTAEAQAAITSPTPPAPAQAAGGFAV